MNGRCRGLLLLTGLVAAGAAPADSFSVSPVRVTLTAIDPIAAVTVRNGGDEPQVFQLEPTTWTQQDGSDRYQPTHELIATPPIFTVPPHGAQVVRIGLRRGPDPRRELAYRLYMQQLPGPPPPGFVGTRVAVRFGVPVFLTPAITGPQTLQWQLLRTADGGLSLACLNAGSLHARIESFTLSPAAVGAPQFVKKVAGDIHAGQQLAWTLQADRLPASGTPLHLTAATERGEVHAELVSP